MALNSQALTKAINEALNAKDKDGNLIDPPEEMEAFAKGIVKAIQAAVVSHPLVTGTAPPAPGPVTDLKALDGVVVVLPSLMITEVTKVIPKGTQIITEMGNHAKYLSSNLKVDFKSGVLKGNSTAAPGPPPIPGALLGGGKGGVLKGINGKDWAQSVMIDKANKDQSENIFEAISNHIKDKGEAIYAPGSVVGTFSAPGAPLVAGVATGGMIK